MKKEEQLREIIRKEVRKTLSEGGLVNTLRGSNPVVIKHAETIEKLIDSGIENEKAKDTIYREMQELLLSYGGDRYIQGIEKGKKLRKV